MAGMIKMNPLHAAGLNTQPKIAMGSKMPGAMTERGLGGAHFAQPEFIQAGHNTSKQPALKHSAAHPGFQALVKRGVPAGALANAARNASSAAKRKNPRLNRVKG